jgi:hypothetical protein
MVCGIRKWYMRPFDFGRGVVYRRWFTGDIRCMDGLRIIWNWICVRAVACTRARTHTRCLWVILESSKGGLLLWWLATACTSTWIRLDLDSGWGACGRAAFKGSLSHINGAFVCKVQAQGCVLCCVFYQLQTSLGLHLQPRRCRAGHPTRPGSTCGTACNGVRL